MALPLLGWFGPLTPGGGIERVVDAAAITYPPAALPANADQWDDTYEILAPTPIWTLQESAAPSVDRGGAHDLETVVGTPDFAQAGESGRRAVLFDGAEALEVLDAALLDSDAATSISIWIRAFIPATLAALRSICGKQEPAGSTIGWRLQISTGGAPSVLIDDGTDSAQPTVGLDHRDGWHNFVFALDRVANEARLHTDLGSSIVDASAVDTIANAEVFALGIAGALQAEGLLVTYAAAWQGYALSAAEAATLAAVAP